MVLFLTLTQQVNLVIGRIWILVKKGKRAGITYSLDMLQGFKSYCCASASGQLQ